MFLGNIPPDFRFSPPGKIHFLPFPTWKKPEKTLVVDFGLTMKGVVLHAASDKISFKKLTR